MILINNRDTVLKQSKLQELMKEENTYRCIDSHISAFFADKPFKKPKRIKYELGIGCWGEDKLTVRILHKAEDSYDWLMNQPETIIGKDIDCHKVRHTELKGIPIDITFTIYCELPIEDFQTLDMLGKVHRSITPSVVSESIFCER